MRPPSKREMIEYSAKHFGGKSPRDWTEKMWLQFCQEFDLGDWRAWKKQNK